MARKGYLLGHGKLGEILLARGLISQQQLEEAVEEQRKRGGRLGDILVELGAIGEDELVEVLAEQLGVPAYLKEAKWEVEPSALRRIPCSLALRYRVFPLAEADGVLRVAMLDPFDVPTIDALKNYTGVEIQPVVISASELQRLMRKYYQPQAKETLETILQQALEAAHPAAIPSGEGEVDVEQLKAEVESAPVVKLVDFLIQNALDERASDIHIEPGEERLSIRYRIDGVLHEVASSPRSLHMAVVSRIKVLSALDIAERRLPQDGRFTMRFDGREVDLRVSTLPTMYGEKVVLRLLEKGGMSYRLEELGFDVWSLEVFRRHIHRPYGMILLTGPTGSGKTTTLYSALLEVKSPGVNVVTVEDPVEYKLPGVYQMQVNPKIGLTFALGLRAILRQDPDIIMVGEIRDLETAEMAVRAALTGHLVFSTLHTNDAVSTVSRLVDMGVEPYLIASVLSLAVAQRLVRRICPGCKEAYSPSRDELASLGLEVPEGVQFFRGRGCERCRRTGYYGRVAIVEVFEVTEEIRRLILQRELPEVLRREATAAGMQSLRQNGMQKVLQGVTTIQEVLRVCLAEG